MGHAILERVLLFGTRSADYIRASGHNGRIQRPYTWLHPTRSLIGQIFPLHRGRRPYMAPRDMVHRRTNSVANRELRTWIDKQPRPDPTFHDPKASSTSLRVAAAGLDDGAGCSTKRGQHLGCHEKIRKT